MYYVIASGKKDSKHVASAVSLLIEKLNERKVNYKIYTSMYPGHAEKLTAEACKNDDCEAIITLGGDGTFYEVLNGIDTRIPIGFIPAGTGNDFARTLGITTNIDECLDNIFNNKPIYLDYLKARDKRSFNLVGSGFDIQLLTREEKIRHHFNTRLSYHVALLQTILFCKFHTIKYRVDGGEIHKEKFFMMDCCNGRWGGGMMPLCIDADPHDGLIDFVVIKKFNRLKMLPLLLKYQKGKIFQTKYFERYKCKKVEIDIEPKLKANLDGELMPLFPVTVEIVHNDLKYFPSSKKPVDPLEVLKNMKTRKNAE